jgi:hypothetical protein
MEELDQIAAGLISAGRSPMARAILRPLDGLISTGHAQA